MKMRDPSGIVWTVVDLAGGWLRLDGGGWRVVFAPPTTDLAALGFTVWP